MIGLGGFLRETGATILQLADMQKLWCKWPLLLSSTGVYHVLVCCVFVDVVLIYDMRCVRGVVCMLMFDTIHMLLQAEIGVLC